MSQLLRLGDDRLLHRYPRDLVANDRMKLCLAPMVPSDWQCLARFLNTIPYEEQQFFRHNMPEDERVEHWCLELDYRHILPLLAWDDDQIAADAKLILDPDVWDGHIGRLRMLVSPAYRSRGIGSAMIREMVSVASELGVRKLMHECAAPQTGLIEFLKHNGFVEAARLSGFVRSRGGTIHDMVVMIVDL